MPDPTEPVIIATFCTAVGIFTATSVVRKLAGIGAPVLPSPATPPPLPPMAAVDLQESETPAWPYQPPATVESVAEPREKGVATGFYRPWDLLGIAFVFLVYFSLVVGSVRSAGDPAMELNAGALITSIIFQFISAGFVTAFVVLRVRPIRWLGLDWSRWHRVFLIAPATVVGMWLLFVGLQFSGYMQWIESLGVEVVQDTVKLLQDSNDPRILGLMAFAAVIAAPVCEEIVFRGYLYSASKRFAGPWAAGICSALVFSAAHGSLAALLPLFIFGCVLAFIYEKTGSLWAPMGVHFCFNGATVLIQLAARYYDLPIDPGP